MAASVGRRRCLRGKWRRRGECRGDGIFLVRRRPVPCVVRNTPLLQFFWCDRTARVRDTHIAIDICTLNFFRQGGKYQGAFRRFISSNESAVHGYLRLMDQRPESDGGRGGVET